MCLESYLYATNHVERPRSNVVSYGRAHVIECDPRDAPRDPRDSQFVFLFSRASDERCYKKFEKVGPFECDELEKHCRVSAKCYPTEIPALYTMAKARCSQI